MDGQRVDTPPKELELLFHLASSPNRVFTRNQLLDEVWGFDYFGDSRTVDVHIKRLREKLEDVSDQWLSLIHISGVPPSPKIRVGSRSKPDVRLGEPVEMCIRDSQWGNRDRAWFLH